METLLCKFSTPSSDRSSCYCLESTSRDSLYHKWEEVMYLCDDRVIEESRLKVRTGVHLPDGKLVEVVRKGGGNYYDINDKTMVYNKRDLSI